jgi:hypothetical protein
LFHFPPDRFLTHFQLESPPSPLESKETNSKIGFVAAFFNFAQIS